MLEVTARLSQGVYLAGEVVEVAITVKNPSPPPNVDADPQGNEVEEEVLAWATAQIHCHCWVSQSKVNVPADHAVSAEESAVTNSLTSFAPCRVIDAGGVGPGGSSGQGGGGGGGVGGNGPAGGVAAGSGGRVVLSTKPVILVCDQRLRPGESKTYWYREVLPVDAPPSFRGQTVKYAYKLTVGTQLVNAPIKLLRVPLRVLVLQEFTDSSILNGSGSCSVSGSGSEDVTQAGNSSLSDSEVETPLDSALQVLQIVTSQKNQKLYNVTNARGHVVKFCAFKHAYKLGEDVVGSLDFTGCNVPCIQFMVTLQSVEEVTPECRKLDGQKPAINSYSKFHEVCVGFQQSHFVLPIPLNVTPSFYTDLVNLKWRLHFEFVTSTEGDKEMMMKPSEKPKAGDLDGQVWQGPTNIKIETMVWDLPIKLYPNLPNYISQGLQTQCTFEMKISNNVVFN